MRLIGKMLYLGILMISLSALVSSCIDIATIAPTDFPYELMLTDEVGDEYDPAWSPDSEQIAFVLKRQEKSYIYIMNLNDGKIRRLTSRDTIESRPTWAPGGDLIAFAGALGIDMEIFSIHIDGTGLQMLTDMVGFDSGPAWSPDGELIVYTSHPYQNVEIVVMRAADGWQRKQLTDHPAIDEGPTWCIVQ